MLTPPSSINPVTTSYNTAASGGASMISINAVANNIHLIKSIDFSYAADPTNGGVSIVDNTNSDAVLLKHAITAGGPGQLQWDPGFECTSGSKISIVMDDGSQTKHLTVRYA